MTAVLTLRPVTNDSFLEMLPAVRRHVRRAFQQFDDDRRQEFMQEVVAYSFVAFVRLLQRGRCHWAFPAALARFGIRRVYSGRRVGTATNRCDVLLDAPGQHRRCTVGRVDFPSDFRAWHETLTDSRHTPIPDQVWFRIDIPEWLSGLSGRNRQIAEALANGDTTTDVANRFRLSPGRISQLRRQLKESWLTFQGEPAPTHAAKRPLNLLASELSVC